MLLNSLSWVDINIMCIYIYINIRDHIHTDNIYTYLQLHENAK